MNYKKVLTRYIQGRLSELSNVDDYEPNKLALTNLLWFLGKATSNEVIVAKLKIMVDADIKRKKYLSRYDGNESLYDDEYSKAVSTIGKKCLSYLRNAKKKRRCKINIRQAKKILKQVYKTRYWAYRQGYYCGKMDAGKIAGDHRMLKAMRLIKKWESRKIRNDVNKMLEKNPFNQKELSRSVVRLKRYGYNKV